MGLLMGNTSGDYVSFPEKLFARRILCFLKHRYLEDAAHQLERETAVFFDMTHLRWLATTARWDDLAHYVNPFLPSPWSSQATAFLHCIHIYRVLGKIAAGGSRVDDIDRLHPRLDAAAAKAHPRIANLHAFFHDVRDRPPRHVETWMKIWAAAAERLKDLALQCPELKGKLHLQVPKYALKRWQINLSGVRSAPRAYKEKGNKPKASDISCFYEQRSQEINKRLSAPEGDTTVVAGMLGGNGSLEYKAAV